ncbi:MAG TPA: diguanylate cyclase [Rhodocyclaceae bacterium]|nr:diguanylate cyclase [Rhodocyclaceae bacterium]
MPSAAKFRALALGLLIVAGTSIGIYWHRLLASTEELRTSVLAQHTVAASRLASAAATQTEALVRNLDSILIHLRADYLAHPKVFNTSLQAAIQGLPDAAVPQIGVIDAEGYLAASSLGAPARIFLGDREHFQFHATGRMIDQLFISSPVLGRRSGSWSIQLSRRIEDGGKFRGVIVASISPEYIAGQLGRFELGANDIIALFRQDGVYLSRYPKLLDYMGKTVNPERPFVGPSTADHGVFRATASHEPVQRIYAWRRLENLPLVSVAGLAEADYIAPVEAEIHRNLVRSGLGTGLAALLAGVIALLLLRMGRQQNDLMAAANLYRSLFEMNTSVKILVDPADGHIVDANPAACTFYGYNREQLLKLNIDDINALPPTAQAAEMAQAVEEHRSYLNLQHRLASGDIREVEVYTGPVSIEGKTLLHSIVHDVTNRRQLEQRVQASEALFRTLFEILPEGILLVGPDGVINAANDAASTVLDVDQEALNNRPYQLFYPDGRQVPADDYPSRRCVRENLILSQALYAVEREGVRRWVTVSSRPMPDSPAGEPMGVAISITDVTRVMELEESLRVSQSVFLTTTEGILVTDANTVITSVNPAFTTITGYPADEAVGQTPRILKSGQHAPGFYREMYDTLAKLGHWEGEINNRRRDGSLYVEWLKINAVKDDDGRITRYVALLSDITAKKRQQEELWHQANYDALTDLPNRILFQDRLQQATAQAVRHQCRVAVMFIDLDRFKGVNDKHGHLAGDELLRQAAVRISNCIRDEDTVARVGGDEFLVLLPNVPTLEVAYGVAEKILNVLNQPFCLSIATVNIGASIGIAVFPDLATTVEELLALADSAMYEAKTAGRGTIRSCQAQPDEAVERDRILGQSRLP